jgi:hypothetical protein
MKSKISTILAGGIPNDNDYMRVVNEIPEIIDSHNAHLAHFPRKTATPLEVKLAYQIRATARNYQWTIAPAIPTGGDILSSYGYRRHGNESGEVIPGNETGDDDDEYEIDDRIQDEEGQQGARDGEEDEIRTGNVEEDEDSFGDEEKNSN